MLTRPKITLKMYNDVGMACQKVCKQGRDDIIVKVNLQSLIPALASFPGSPRARTKNQRKGESLGEFIT